MKKSSIAIILSVILITTAGCESGDTPGNTISETEGSNTDSADTGSHSDTGSQSETESDPNTDTHEDTSSHSETGSLGDTGSQPGTESDTTNGSDEDTGCADDLSCPEEQYCGDNNECVDDVCVPGTSHCEGDAVRECDPNGGGWTTLHTCDSPNDFVSECSEDKTRASCSCEDDWDCPPFTECEAGQCLGTGVEPTCSLPPEPFENVLPAIEIEWGGQSPKKPEAVGSPFPEAAQTVMTPLVANLDDDNGDGLIDERDFPEIIFSTFESNYKVNGVLRAIHGGGPNKGLDYFATCGDKVWREGDDTGVSCKYSSVDFNPTSALAVGDIDNDGKPEIVALREAGSGGFAIYDNTGALVSKNDVNTSYNQNPAPAVANLDGAGLSEIVIGRHAYTLDKDPDTGIFSVRDHFEGRYDKGVQGQGPISCVADIAGDARLEIIAGTSAYRLPTPPDGVTRQSECKGSQTDPEEVAFCKGDLVTVWNASDLAKSVVTEGFCAIADILGEDENAPPGPDNPLDKKAEVITISSGYLQIFNGETGEMRRQIKLDSDRGGAPNIDDFDGDGFPEVGSAFSSKYVMYDLQAPTEHCPEWPIAFDDNNDDLLQGNPDRNQDCLHNGWMRITEDGSSRVTGSSVFDFNGDGSAEVVYNDECYFRVYDGKTGRVLFKEPSESRTRIEYPIVADVDNDGNAEIVFGTSNESGFCSEGASYVYNNGLEVWGDASDTWVSARRMWNQHAYHVTNVTESAGIPIKEPKSWLEYNGRAYNTFRSNPRSYGVAPDLTLTGIQISSPDATCGELSKLLDVTVRIENKGDLRIGPGVVVSYYGQWTDAGLDEPLYADGSQTPLTAAIATSLEPGDSMLLTVSYDSAHNSPGALPDKVRVIVDEANKERECVEDNNSIVTNVDPGEVLPDLAITLGLASKETCPTPTVETTVTNLGSAPASDIVVHYYAGDPGQGGTFLDETTVAGPLAPNGGTTTFLHPLANFPENKSVRIWAVVDPNDTIEECNDGNNTDSADNMVRCAFVPR